MSWYSQMLTQIAQAIEHDDGDLDAILDQVTANSAKLDRVLALLVPPQPDHMVVTLSGGNNMAKAGKLGKVKITLIDNGTARAKATVVDSVGLPADATGMSVATCTSSDPGLVCAPDPADPTGLTQILSPATPPVLVSGATITFDAVLADGTTHITGSNDPADPINVVAGGPAGFKVTQSAN